MYMFLAFRPVYIIIVYCLLSSEWIIYVVVSYYQIIRPDLKFLVKVTGSYVAQSCDFTGDLNYNRHSSPGKSWKTSFSAICSAASSALFLLY